MAFAAGKGAVNVTVACAPRTRLRRPPIGI